MPRLLEVRQTMSAEESSKLLAEGFHLISISAPAESAGGFCWFHLGRYEDEQEEDWTQKAAEWLTKVDADQLERDALEGMGLGDSGGTQAILSQLLKYLGDA